MTETTSVSTEAGGEQGDREVVLTREIAAPRALVYMAFTSVEHLGNWFGPDGFTITTIAADIRPGGQWRFIMHGPDGTDYDNRMSYTELVAPERLVFWHGRDLDDDPGRFHVTVTFEERDGKTILTQRSVFPSVEACQAVKRFGAVELGNQTMAKLAAHVEALLAPTGEAFEISRELAAPPQLVFAAWTEAERLAKWWGPRGASIEVLSLVPAPGGAFHFEMRLPDGGRMWARFTYLDLVPAERLVYVSAFSDERGGLARAPFSEAFPLRVLNVVTFEALPDGKTRLTLRGAPLEATSEERACYMGMHESMQGGYAGTFDRLDAYLASGEA